MQWLAALALGLALANPASAAAPVQGGPAEAITLGTISARLFYQFSGRLSEDLLSRPEPFVGWNTVIGEGSAEEPAGDLLVDVSLAGTGEDESFVSDPLELWVTTKGGKTLARRTFTGMLVPNTGALHSPLWLPDVGCAGALTIHARFRKQTKTARLSLDCGE